MGELMTCEKGEQGEVSSQWLKKARTRAETEATGGTIGITNNENNAKLVKTTLK